MSIRKICIFIWVPNYILVRKLREIRRPTNYNNGNGDQKLADRVEQPEELIKFFKFGEAEKKLFNADPAEGDHHFAVAALRGAADDDAFAELDMRDTVAGFHSGKRRS
jgi:hypothetical protein